MRSEPIVLLIKRDDASLLEALLQILIDNSDLAAKAVPHLKEIGLRRSEARKSLLRVKREIVRRTTEHGV